MITARSSTLTSRLAGLLVIAVAAATVATQATAEPDARGATRTPQVTVTSLTEVLGRPTDRSVALSVLAPDPLEAYAEWGTKPGRYTARTALSRAPAETPLVLSLAGLKRDTAYAYRLRYRAPGASSFRTGAAHVFHTQRAPGSTFTFSLQGDSHPERAGKMYAPTLYRRTMSLVAAGRPDFYLLLGDDFSVDPLYAKGQLTQETADQLYADQRSFLTKVAGSAPLFLVNGNHEQAARVNLNGTPNNPAVYAGTARNRFYPLPAPDRFYTGDTQKVEFIGLPRDYYAWTWGDALFVVIDPYWHSPVLVDSGPGAQGGGGKDPGGKNRDWWGITIGDPQYQWLKRTLERSKAKYKFVFTHHVLGSGRGGVEEAGLYEWGGKDPSGEDLFSQKRPTWAMPIQQLMTKNDVTIFFQGHDHLFAKQSLDGVVYQETPNPADPTYAAFNRDAYKSGTVLPNSGHLRVTVSPRGVRVDYVLSVLPKDETVARKNGAVAFSYTAR